MTTNEFAILMQSMQAPIRSFSWEVLTPAIAALVLALAGLVKVFSMDKEQRLAAERSAIAHAKAEKAEIKAEANAKVVETILVDVNSNKSKMTDKATAQETIVLALTKELAEMKEKFRSLELHNAQTQLSTVQLAAATRAMANGTQQHAPAQQTPSMQPLPVKMVAVGPAEAVAPKTES